MTFIDFDNLGRYDFMTCIDRWWCDEMHVDDFMMTYDETFLCHDDVCWRVWFYRSMYDDVWNFFARLWNFFRASMNFFRASVKFFSRVRRQLFVRIPEFSLFRFPRGLYQETAKSEKSGKSQEISRICQKWPKLRNMAKTGEIWEFWKKMKKKAKIWKNCLIPQEGENRLESTTKCQKNPRSRKCSPNLAKRLTDKTNFCC